MYVVLFAIVTDVFTVIDVVEPNAVMNAFVPVEHTIKPPTIALVNVVPAPVIVVDADPPVPIVPVLYVKLCAINEFVVDPLIIPVVLELPNVIVFVVCEPNASTPFN